MQRWEGQRRVTAAIEAEVLQQRFGADGGLNIVLADHDPELEVVKPVLHVTGFSGLFREHRDSRRIPGTSHRR